MSLLKRIELSVAISLVFCVVLNIISFAVTSEKIRGEILRLHVIANSDSAADQNLKLAVRDALLEAGIEIFDGSVTVQNAESKIQPEIDKLIKISEKVIRSYGFEYDVDITISTEYFSTRTYNQITLPAGEYLALRVVIGDGDGHNWWCVMFPPMCLTAADENDVLSSVLSEHEMNLVNKNPKIEPRFKIVEIFENIKRYFNEQN